MGYLVVILMIGLLLSLIVKQIWQFFFKTRKQGIYGYYLLVEKQKENNLGKFYGTFQQGGKEYRLELAFSLYIHLQVPQRGYLHAENGKVVTFKTEE